LPITAYDASQTTAPSTSRLPSQASWPAGASALPAGLAKASSPMPRAAQAIAVHVRPEIGSRRNARLRSATVAGMAAMITPAETALVRLTPHSMHSENRKLPRKDSRNSRRRVRGVRGASVAGLRSQCSIARPPMPKRSQASRNTGIAAASGFDSAT
jgi:hypothetical protein